MDITRIRPLAFLAAGFLALACGDDSSKGTSGGGSDTDGTDSGTDSGSGGSGGTTAGSDSATGGTTGGSTGGGSGSTSGGATEVTLIGEVRDYVLDQPIGDVTINIYPDNMPTTTADALGVFSLGPVPANTTVHVTLPETTDYWGAVIPTAVGDVDPQEVELAMIGKGFVQSQQDLLADQMPAVHDPTTAFMVVRVLQNTAINEGNVTITVDPAPPTDTYYAPDPDGAPILGSNEAQWGLLPVVIYYNLTPMAPGGYTVTATHAVRQCDPAFAEFPTLGGHITLVNIDCPPV